MAWYIPNVVYNTPSPAPPIRRWTCETTYSCSDCHIKFYTVALSVVCLQWYASQIGMELVHAQVYVPMRLFNFTSVLVTRGVCRGRDACHIHVRGLVQSPCGNFNVIMTLTFYPPPPPLNVTAFQYRFNTETLILLYLGYTFGIYLYSTVLAMPSCIPVLLW